MSLSRRNLSTSPKAARIGAKRRDQEHFARLVEEIFMRLSSFTIMLVLGFSGAFAPPALAAVNCDIGKCISICSKGKVGTAIQGCNSWCQQTIQERKNAKQCK
jgi:hypothetical protein